MFEDETDIFDTAGDCCQFLLIPGIYTMFHIGYFIIAIYPVMISSLENFDLEYIRDDQVIIHYTFPDKWGWITVALLYIFSLLFLLAYCRLRSVNIKSKNIIRPGQNCDGLNVCINCKDTIKTQDTYHCHECEVCVDGHDHHCGVLGICIGEVNLKYFI